MSTLIKICNGQSCQAKLSQYTYERALSDLNIEDLNNEENASTNGEIVIKKTACMGKCNNGPVVKVEQFGNTHDYYQTSSVVMGDIIKNIKK